MHTLIFLPQMIAIMAEVTIIVALKACKVPRKLIRRHLLSIAWEGAYMSIEMHSDLTQVQHCSYIYLT
jgi:xanthosine utilization system XapX-like protein